MTRKCSIALDFTQRRFYTLMALSKHVLKVFLKNLKEMFFVFKSILQFVDNEHKTTMIKFSVATPIIITTYQVYITKHINTFWHKIKKLDV